MRTTAARRFSLAVASILAFSSAWAQAVHRFDVAAQPLGKALNALAAQAGVNVYFDPSDVEGMNAVGMKLEATTDDALKALLAGTDLEAVYVNDKTVRVAKKGKIARAGREDVLRLALAQSTADSAADGGDGGVKLEEVLVTAQKREERLQNVPISMSVLGGGDLDRSTVQDVSEALSQVPGVAISEASNFGRPMISIRGVGPANPLFAGSSPIAYYLDSVPFGFVRTAITPDTSAYDLERVEVLRGPQGTLYGASAQNGVVRVLTKDAELDSLEFKARASASNTRYGGENYRSDMALNVPIIQNKLAARAVVGYQDLSGWIDRPNDGNANDAQLSNLRLKVNAQPTEQLSIGLSSWFSRSDFGAPSAADDNRQHRSSYEDEFSADYDSFGLQVGYEFPSFSLNSSTSYLDYSFDADFDSALTGLSILTTNVDASVLTEEVNLSSTHRGPWRWSLGGIYRDAEDGFSQIRLNPVTGGLTGGYVAPNHLVYFSESFAVYGELTRLFAGGTFELTGGLRYFEDKVQQRELSFPFPPARPLTREETTFDALSPRAVLSWHASDQMSAYASYAEGFRSGSDQMPAVLVVAPDFAPADSDNLKNYEVGVKGGLLNGRLAFDASVYFMDWQRVQNVFIVEVAPGTINGVLINGTSASGMGFDLGMRIKPAQAWTLDFGYSVNDLTQDEDVRAGNTLIFNAGERLNYSPKYTLSGALEYVFPLGAGFRGRLAASANHTSERTQRFLNITSVTVGNKPITMARASFAIESSDARWVASLFADNLNNEQDAVISLPAGSLQPERSVRVRPRTLGVQLEYRFD